MMSATELWLRLMAIPAGLAIGSFAATAAIRFARGERFAGGGSHCDGCGAALGFAASLPLFSYARRGGVATCCGASIDRLHPIGELAGAIVATLAVVLTPAAAQAPAFVLLGALLLSLALIDLRTGRLPNALVALVALACLIMTSVFAPARLAEGLISALVSLAALEALRWGFLKTRGDAGLGGGDVKLIAALALWLGIWTPLMLAAASMLGLVQVLVTRPRQTRIVFGPAIAVAGFIMALSIPRLGALL